MKSLLTLSVVAVLFAGCQAASVNQTADTQTIDLPGTQARTTVEIQQGSRSADAPYALAGQANTAGAATPEAYVSHGTINGF